MTANPTFFATAAEFRRWLRRHHKTAPEIWVGFYKKDCGRKSISYSESLDEALCFGWIDGVRRSVDSTSYMNRFSPRRKGSYWSTINIGRARALIRAGLMQPAGLAAFKARDVNEPRRGSYEQKTPPKLTRALEARFKARPEAWRFFNDQPPGYRRLMCWYVISAKQEATRERRLQIVIDVSAKGRRLEPMAPRAKGDK
jgi:uncharacterized protein YdeI (YjbR/CyaY-like superfamily)